MANNLAEIYKKAAEENPDSFSFFGKNKQKEFEAVTFKQLYEDGICLSEALISMGMKFQEKVAVMADHKPEWALCDAGVLLAGAANVPRGTDVTDSEFEYILNHAKSKILFVHDKKMLDRYNKLKRKIKTVKTVIVMDEAYKGRSKNVHNVFDLVKKGRELRTKGKHETEKRMKRIKPSHLFTLIYTSGTTGAPKGVMLTHANMVHQADDVVSVFNFQPDEDTILSILPVWHVFERFMYYSAIFYGVPTYITNIRNLKSDFTIAKPTFMASAPRLWENIYQGIYAKVNNPKMTPPVRKMLFNIAYFYSKHYHSAMRIFKGYEVDYTGRNIIQSAFLGIKAVLQFLFTAPFLISALGLVAGLLCQIPAIKPVFYTIAGLGLIFNYETLDKIVLSKIRLATGGRLKATISGGGALQRHVDAFFNDIGIDVLEGYGMTETCPVIAYRTFSKLVMGSVGNIAPKSVVQIRDLNSSEVLAELDGDGNFSGQYGKKGVIFIKGPQVMKGYYKNPKETKKALQKGWMNTGDIGMINFKNALTLTGRAKETVVLLGGENVEPVPIENKISASEYVNQCMVIGQDQKTLGILIVPNFEKLEVWAKDNGISGNKKALVSDVAVNKFFKTEVRKLNSAKTGFKSFEQVQGVILIAKEFEVGDELTNLMKMKRHVITEKYSKEITNLYKD